MVTHYISAIKNYVEFSGRATRPQYWYFFLANILISFVIGIVEMLLGLGNQDGGPLTSLYSLFILLPSIAVAVRRIHDSDKSGWWILLPIYNLYLLIRKGTEGENRFGPDPKGTTETMTETAPAATEAAPEMSMESEDTAASEMDAAPEVSTETSEATSEEAKQ